MITVLQRRWRLVRRALLLRNVFVALFIAVTGIVTVTGLGYIDRYEEGRSAGWATWLK